jgi:hypothetical protein
MVFILFGIMFWLMITLFLMLLRRCVPDFIRYRVFERFDYKVVDMEPIFHPTEVRTDENNRTPVGYADVKLTVKEKRRDGLELVTWFTAKQYYFHEDVNEFHVSATGISNGYLSPLSRPNLAPEAVLERCALVTNSAATTNIHQFSLFDHYNSGYFTPRFLAAVRFHPQCETMYTDPYRHFRMVGDVFLVKIMDGQKIQLAYFIQYVRAEVSRLISFLGGSFCMGIDLMKSIWQWFLNQIMMLPSVYITVTSNIIYRNDPLSVPVLDLTFKHVAQDQIPVTPTPLLKALKNVWRSNRRRLRSSRGNVSRSSLVSGLWRTYARSIRPKRLIRKSG